jgi:hypothetical protein
MVIKKPSRRINRRMSNDVMRPNGEGGGGDKGGGAI